ncbi:hypothetical protein QQF64_034344, partial [Cirrhinus molitorella]
CHCLKRARGAYPICLRRCRAGHQSPGGSAVEHQTFNLRVQGSSPCSGDELSVCYRPSAEATRDVALDIDPLNALGPEPTEMRWPEIETESAAWKTAMLTTIPPMQEVGNGFRGQKKNARSMQVTDRDKGTETIFVYARPGFGCRHQPRFESGSRHPFSCGRRHGFAPPDDSKDFTWRSSRATVVHLGENLANPFFETHPFWGRPVSRETCILL